jgi:predicted NAD/FAD-binding protein
VREHFSEPEPNVIESSAGFSVRVLGRTGLCYAEGPRSVWIDSEVLAKPRAIAMFKESIRVWEGPAPAQVTALERDQIADNIKRAFEACGYELQVQGPFDWSSVALRSPNKRHKL